MIITTEQSSFPPNIFEWKLDKDGLMRAVEYWLNAEVLQSPCEVTDISLLESHPKSATFSIKFTEVLDEQEDDS